MAVNRKYERDIDIFLAEEFSTSPPFASWLLSKTKFGSINATVRDVSVSSYDHSGESDLTVLFEADDGRNFALLIEDKVDAKFQHEQYERYEIRAKNGIATRQFDSYEVVLCAPSAYFLAHKDLSGRFPCHISYEEIATFLDADKSPRGAYRAEFIRTAAVKKINAWEFEEDEATKAFWDAAYNIASKKYPILEMKHLRQTKNSVWITIRPREMPTQPIYTCIGLKGSQGNADLSFGRTTARVFHGAVRSILESDMTVHQTGAATAIRLEFEPFNIHDGLSIGLDRVTVAFDKAARLVKFYFENKELLDRAAQSATSKTNQ